MSGIGFCTCNWYLPVVFSEKWPIYFVLNSTCIIFSTLNQWRNVAQLVAHYVRDVGVGRSSRLIPTKGDK